AALDPLARRHGRLLGEPGDPARRLNALALLEAQRAAAALIVEARRRTDRLRDPIDRDIGQQVVLREPPLAIAVAIAPGAKLFDAPGGQSHRRVVQAVGQRLRPGPLDLAVAPSGLNPLLPRPQKGLFRLGQLARLRPQVWHIRAGDVVEMYPDDM